MESFSSLYFTQLFYRALKYRVVSILLRSHKKTVFCALRCANYFQYAIQILNYLFSSQKLGSCNKPLFESTTDFDAEKNIIFGNVHILARHRSCQTANIRHVLTKIRIEDDATFSLKISTSCYRRKFPKRLPGYVSGDQWSQFKKFARSFWATNLLSVTV